nr:PREDICTED: lysosomal alpha-glucosidase-like isoform X3 [Megachile rotundata]
MDANKANNVTLRNMFSRKYFKYIFPCDLFRLILTIIVLCILILVVKETKYIVVQQYEINIIIKDIHEVVDEKWKYNVTLEEMPGTIQCNNIPVGLRFDCHPEDGASELSCKSRGCCWNPINKQISKIKRAPLNVPYCYYSKNWTIYKYENYSKEGNEFIGFLKQTGNSFYENDLPFVKVEISSVDDSILRVKMYDPSKTRYEPPWPVRPDPKPFTRKNINAKYKLDIDNTKLGFKVYRTSDDTTIFDSFNVGGFIFANQFLQISALLPTHNIYGIGEHQTGLKLNTNWQSFTLFNKDQPPIENANLYGSHPFYLMMENSGKSHGVLFLNSNAMDVILQPSPGITFRSIGGIFDMYIFLGPSPADVVRQYSEIVGKPFLPPYWSLGFHLCRYGYKTLEETKKVWNRTVAAEIPFDTQWNDLDYMDKNNDFTYNLEKFKDLPKFVKELHSRGMHYIPLIDAGISGSESNGSYAPYDEGLKEDLLVKDAAINRPFVGKVWNMISTVWPDFTNPKTPEYYFRMMRNLHNSFPFDGAWIDMNEPSNFYNGGKEGCTKNDLDYPKYVPNVIEGLLATKTLCMNAKHYLGNHYDLHNTYGIGQAVATNYALRKIRGKRPFIISRSSWVGQGHYSGHWTGDVYSCWFPSDSNTYDIDAQFLWGSSLMIVPVLEEGKKTVTAYLPRGPWYDLYTRNVTFGVDKYYTLNAPLDIIPLMIRGGSILPVQRPATTTTESRKNDLELLIALDHVNKAKGELYWDDGDSLDSYEKEEFVWLLFEVENDTLSSYKAEKKSRFKEKIALNRIEIWGIRQNVTQVYLNGRKIPFDYDNEDNYLDAANLQIDPRNEFKLSWK